jgi:hypothetical protein
MPSNDERNLYSQLLVINRQAFTHAHYEVAYHALAAALHSAYDTGDQERLRDVQFIATSQRDWIDTHQPDHRLSTSSARARGQNSMFTMLERQAAAAGTLQLHRRSEMPDE